MFKLVKIISYVSLCFDCFSFYSTFYTKDQWIFKPSFLGILNLEFLSLRAQTKTYIICSYHYSKKTYLINSKSVIFPFTYSLMVSISLCLISISVTISEIMSSFFLQKILSWNVHSDIYNIHSIVSACQKKSCFRVVLFITFFIISCIFPFILK